MDRSKQGERKVAILTHSLDGGGAERVISNLSGHIGEDYELTLLLLDSDGAHRKDGVRTIGIWSRGLPEGSDHGLPFNPVRLIQMMVSLRREVKRNGFSLVLSFLEIPNFLNLMTFGKHRRIVSVRNHMSGKRKGFLGNLAVRFVTIFTDHTIAVSAMCRLDLIEGFGADPERVSVLPNPVDLEMIDRLRDEGLADCPIPDGVPVIVNVARLTEAKGHDRLIQSFCRVRETIPDARLVLVGDGDMKERLMGMTRNLGVDEHVIFAGFQKNPYRFIQRSDVFVLSSHYEGFPNALLEALACGVPVISTDCLSGPRELLSPNTDPSSVAKGIEHADYGILVPPWGNDIADLDNERTMAEAIVRLLSDDDLRNLYISRGRERVSDFAAPNVRIVWDEFIKEHIKDGV